jgi:hypothetical protein
MKIQLTIPDDVYEKLQLVTPKSKSVEQTIVALVTEWPLDLRERNVLLSNEERKEIEVLLGVPVPNAKELLRRIATHASVTLGNIRLSPTAAQMKKLESRAKANHRSGEEEANVIFQQIAANFFGYV